MLQVVLEETLETLQASCQYDRGSTQESSSSRSALVQKLYKHKLQVLLQQHNTTLLRCKCCGQLFASSRHTKLECPAALAPYNRCVCCTRFGRVHPQHACMPTAAALRVGVFCKVVCGACCTSTRTRLLLHQLTLLCVYEAA